MAKLDKNVFTICFERNGSKIIYSSGTFFEINEDVKLINVNDSLEQKLAWVFENFNVSESGFYFYYHIKNNPIRHAYIAESNKAYINNREVVIDGFAEQAFATGHVSFKNKPILQTFEIAAKNFDKFKVVENLVEIQDGPVSISVFRVGNKAYIYRINESTQIKQFNEWSPIKTVEYVIESTGEDISFMFQDILESTVTLQNKIQQRLDETYEILSFLKSQKELFADSNRNIAEIKEAEKIINTEIVKFEQIIQILEDDNLTKDNGYLNAKIMTAYQDVPEGSEVKVDALDYTTAGKDDMITIIMNDKPIKVIKKHVELEAVDSI